MASRISHPQPSRSFAARYTTPATITPSRIVLLTRSPFSFVPCATLKTKRWRFDPCDFTQHLVFIRRQLHHGEMPTTEPGTRIDVEDVVEARRPLDRRMTDDERRDVTNRPAALGIIPRARPHRPRLQIGAVRPVESGLEVGP